MDDAQATWLQGLVGPAQAARYPGLYRAAVLRGADADPSGAGRVLVRVSAVSEGELWAAPCRTGTPPGIGDAAWVMFEEGDAARPVLVGGAG